MHTAPSVAIGEIRRGISIASDKREYQRARAMLETCAPGHSNGTGAERVFLF